MNAVLCLGHVVPRLFTVPDTSELPKACFAAGGREIVFFFFLFFFLFG